MIPVSRPLLGSAEASAAAGVIRSNWLPQGGEVAAFEREFAERVGALHACAVANCTAALHLALLAAGITPGDEVVLPGETHIACANTIRMCGGQPVFVETEPTCNMDPTALAAALTPRTRAILCVHQMGMPCDLPRILPMARAAGILVIEDAACAFGSKILIDSDWELVGRPHGDIACFSFNLQQVLTTGEGGMLTTARSAWDRLFRLLRGHAVGAEDGVEDVVGAPPVETQRWSGYNYRLTDLQAAIGREQLRRLDAVVIARRTLAARYKVFLADLEVVCPDEQAWAQSNWQGYCVRLPEDVSLAVVVTAMKAHGVTTGHFVTPRVDLGETYAHAADPWASPAGRNTAGHCLRLPLFATMSERLQRRVAVALKSAIETARRGL
ncbi:DegT/DnrJ/EryC1/StrS family aminotransferase [Hansschlegelia zhihuaiae]|uniref:DegT/DnrJ/EryC1/StrS family aminotransferase n=1 Tax=Hansschlegelia zhihuaiae TaxID=405005 RepID=A0A4Q0MCD8_9HYPH|nr:DegT/DnrJ/EryC1/StrS family aminotransferase [Hansschlegelia zhihuaiae]